MRRRSLLAAAASGSAALTAGCLGRLPLVGSTVETEFERTAAELRADERPAVSVEDDAITVRGTVAFGSSECGTVEVAHAGYERSQERVDLLVVAADESSGLGGCSDDLVETGYRLEATVNGSFRRVSVTEHHVFGEAYSTTVDGLG